MMLEGFLGDLLIAALSAGLMYAIRRPKTIIETHERVRIEHVKVPYVVEKEVLRIERIEVPVVVDRPSVQVVENVIEKVVEVPVLQVERVPVGPAAAAMPSEAVTVHLMDPAERKVKHTQQIDARLRRPVIEHGGVRYQCVRQDADGHWIYREAR